MNDISNRKVYVGNIPYTANKQEVESFLRIIGPVLNFDLHEEKDPTKDKKHKGYGFCEFADEYSALSAIKNLKDVEFQNRNLKVNFEDKKAKLEQLMMNKGQKGDALMDFDPKKFEENNEHRNLFEVLEALEADQKYFLMLELKNLKELIPQDLKKILSSNPKLCQAFLDIQKELGMDLKPELKKRSEKETHQKPLPKQPLLEEPPKILKKLEPEAENPTYMPNLNQNKPSQMMYPAQHPIQNPNINFYNNMGYQGYNNNSNNQGYNNNNNNANYSYMGDNYYNANEPNFNNMKNQKFVDQRNYQGNYQYNQDFNNNQNLMMKNKMNKKIDMQMNMGKYGGMNPQMLKNPPNMMGQNMNNNGPNNMQNFPKNRMNNNNKMWNNTQNNKHEEMKEMSYGDKVIKKIKPNEKMVVENKANLLENYDELSKEDNEEELQFSPSKSKSSDGHEDITNNEELRNILFDQL